MVSGDTEILSIPKVDYETTLALNSHPTLDVKVSEEQPRAHVSRKFIRFVESLHRGVRWSEATRGETIVVLRNMIPVYTVQVASPSQYRISLFRNVPSPDLVDILRTYDEHLRTGFELSKVQR